MGQGMQSKSLIIMSKAQGFDPTRIWDATTQSYGESIENFDKAPAVLSNQAGLGRIPEGLQDTYPMDSPAFTEQVTWNAPDTSRESSGAHITYNLESGQDRSSSNLPKPPMPAESSPWVGGKIGG